MEKLKEILHNFQLNIEQLGIKSFFKSKYGKKFLVILEVLLAIGFFLQPQLYYDASAPTFMKRFYADSLTICGALWAILVFLTVKKIEISEKWNRRINKLLLVFFPIVCFLWLEYYDHMQFWGPVFKVEKQYQILNLLIYYVIYLIILLLCNSVRRAAVVMMVCVAAFGIMNYELTVFRNMSFIASDIYSVLTALSVANTYEAQIDVDTAEFFLLALVIIALLFQVKREPFLKGKKRLGYFVFCIAMVVGFCNVYVYSDFLENIGVDFRVYRPQFKYRYFGTLLTTVRTFGYLHVTEPEGYSAEAVDDLIEEYRSSKAAQTSSDGDGTDSQNDSQTDTQKQDSKTGKKPNIIAVMNESFADFQAIGDVEVTQDYMPYFRSLKENTIKGYTYSSVFGGNTANSEFEFLTGNTMAFLPDNSVPYQLFLRTEISGLTRTLKDQDYGSCLALHPYYKTGYGRYKVYPLMGFDRFYTSEDFDIFTETVNYHITDQEDFSKIISLYENREKKDEPFYLFNVTMQNHGSYDGSTYETGDDVQLKGNLEGQSWAEQYLNMIKMSDEALHYLIDYFKEVEEPTVIVFFGDHMPDLEEDFYDSLLGVSTDELEGEELEQLYKVPFLIWANYDIEEQTVERTSNNYLQTYLAQAAGIETTDYMDFLTDLREKVPCINAIGYWGDDGKFYEIDDTDSPYYDLIYQYRLLEYNNIFGEEEKRNDFFNIK